MGFLKKLFSGGFNEPVQHLPPAEEEQQLTSPGNSQQVGDAGLDEKEGKGSWLSRAWNGIVDFGSALAHGGKEGATVGGGIGAVPGGLIGGGIGGALGALGGKKSAGEGAKGLGKVLALPGALIGGAIGGLVGMVSAAADHMTSDDEALLEEAADIPGFHVILEQLAHVYAYGKGDESTLEAWGLELSAEHEDSNSGFRVVAFSPLGKQAVDPDGKPLEPVVAFRGTANSGGALDDLNDEGIGTFQFSRNEKEISNVIQQAKGPSAPVVTGHSLGGALAQLAAARFGGMVGDIVTFQAAGINATEAMRIDADQHEATHYRTGGDLVPSGGEGFAVGSVIQFDSKGLDTALSHMTFPLAQLNALRGKSDSDHPKVEGVRSDADEWVRTGEDGEFHTGHWKDSESSTESQLNHVSRHEANDAPQAGIVEAIGGKRAALWLARLAAKTGLADRQQDYARAWREIRAVCMNIQGEAQISGVRKRVVDLCIDHEVEPRDHARFISQAEAAMLDALELLKTRELAQGA